MFRKQGPPLDRTWSSRCEVGRKGRVGLYHEEDVCSEVTVGDEVFGVFWERKGSDMFGAELWGNSSAGHEQAGRTAILEDWKMRMAVWGLCCRSPGLTKRGGVSLEMRGQRAGTAENVECADATHM